MRCTLRIPALASYFCLIAALCSPNVSASGVRGGGRTPREMSDFIQRLADDRVPIRSVCFTTDGGWVVAYDGGVRGGGRTPREMSDFIQRLADDRVPIRSVCFT